MQSVNDIYNFVNFELNKNQSGSTLNKAEFNTCLAWANLEYYKLYYGLAEQYQPGQPLPKIAYESTQLIMDKMSKFKQWMGGDSLPQMAINVDGIAAYPSDYVHCSSIRYFNTTSRKWKTVVILRDDQVSDALDDSITPPTKDYPIAVLYDTFIKFYPTDIAFVDFVYLRLPVTPVWGATFLNDEWVYSESLSTQLEWDQTAYTDIANLIVGYAARNLKDTFNVTLAERRKQEGT